MIAKGEVRAGPHNTSTDAGLRALVRAYEAKGEIKNGLVLFHMDDESVGRELSRQGTLRTSCEAVAKLRGLNPRVHKFFLLDRCPEYTSMEREELPTAEETEEIEEGSNAWLESRCTERKKRRTGCTWEDGISHLDYREMEKVGGGRIPRLKGERDLVRHALAERIGTGRLNEHRLLKGKGEVRCKCGKPRERGHYLECETFDESRLVEYTLKSARKNPGAWLVGEGVKDLMDWLSRSGYHNGWVKGSASSREAGATEEEVETARTGGRAGDRKSVV